MKTSFFTFLIFGLIGTAHAETSKCKYEVDSNTLQVGWTAFKTSQKLGVNGTFSGVELKGASSKSEAFTEFLSQLKAELNLALDKIHTGNPGRDETLSEHFFHHFSHAGKVSGMIQNVHGDSAAGDFTLSLQMNGKKQAVPFHYTRDAKTGAFEAKGTIDVTKFGLSEALGDLHHNCEELHKGADGVSKTWPNVDIKLTAAISEKCGS